MAVKHLPHRTEIEKKFEYDHFTGALVAKEGQRTVKTLQKRGYRMVRIDGESYLAHRVIWKMVYDEEPVFIDHINGNRHDNRLVNLRSIDRHGNNRNKATQANNVSGVNGVTFREGKWVAQIPMPDGGRHLGKYVTVEEAIAARRAAERVLGYHKNHGRSL